MGQEYIDGKPRYESWRDTHVRFGGPLVADLLLACLNEDILPVVPSQGSVGASGDLAPLAHVALALIGEGEAVQGARALSGPQVPAAAGREPLTLEAGLAHLASAPFDGIELDVDLKLPGYELRVVEALRALGLIERALVSSQYIESLVRIRRAEPGLRLGWSVPRAARDYTRSALWALPALTALEVFKRALPSRAAASVAAGRCDAVMAHWRVVTPRLVRALEGAGGELYVWTVDDAERIAALAALGVTGVITNDPRLFGERG